MDSSRTPNIRRLDGVTPALGERVFVDSSAVIVGDVTLGDDVSVWPQVSVRGDVHTVRVGARSSIQDGCVLHVTHAGPFNPDGWPLAVGEDVTVGHNATLHGCTISDRVLVGMGAIVMDGAVVESEVVIAAAALVTPGKHLRSGFLYAGSPAREVRALSGKEREYFLYSAANYVKLKDRYLSASAG